MDVIITLPSPPFPPKLCFLLVTSKLRKKNEAIESHNLDNGFFTSLFSEEWTNLILGLKKMKFQIGKNRSVIMAKLRASRFLRARSKEDLQGQGTNGSAAPDT